MNHHASSRYPVTDGLKMRLRVDAAPHVDALLARLGRTEDVCFSPSNMKMAVAGFAEDSCCIFDIAFDRSGNLPGIVINGWSDLRSSILKLPHGLAFAGEDHLIVANRGGKLAVLEISGIDCSGTIRPVKPLRVIGMRSAIRRLYSPGSVCITRFDGKRVEVLVCNNYRHMISRHRFPLRGGPALPDNAVVLENGLDIPDGIDVHPGGRWVAISNHSTHEVLIYDKAAGLSREAVPAGRALGNAYPHGIRFLDNGRLLCVADAGAPVVRFYSSDDGDWSGVRHPLKVVRVLEEEVFQRGHTNEMEGGPKGIAINAAEDVLVVTCEEEALAFFHLPSLLEAA